MNAEEIIKVLDALGKKFGIAVNWTEENVLPYLQELGSRIIRYEIATSVFIMIIGIICLFIGLYGVKKVQYCRKRFEKDRYSQWDYMAILVGVGTVCIFIIGGIIVIHEALDIITCYTLPEKIILRVINSVSVN